MDGKEELTIGKVWKNAIIRALKIIVLVFSLVCLCFAMLVYAFPKTGAKLTNRLGMTNAERFCYNTIYERSGNIVDLYNLVLFEEGADNPAGEFKYISSLTSMQDYGTFCEKLDDASLKACSDKKRLAYIFSTDMFLKNQKVKCMFLLDIDPTNFIEEELKRENLLDNSLSTYVSMVIGSNLSAAQKVAKLNLLMNKAGMVNLIENRINGLKDKCEELLEVTATNQITQQFAERVVYTYLLMNYYQSCYSLYSLANFEGKIVEKAEEYRVLWQNSAQEYDQLVK